jgi:CheY-like chemotaxis protein
MLELAGQRVDRLQADLSGTTGCPHAKTRVAEQVAAWTPRLSGSPAGHPCMVWVAVFPAVHRFATIFATMPNRILIVDDHPSFRATVKVMLLADGFEVVGEAADGRTALEAVERLKPDLVLLDVQLPDMDGFTVVNELRRRDSYRPKIVLTSSHDESDFGPIVARCGVAAFVPKGELSGAALRAVLR